MTNCENYKPLIVGLLDQELTPEETQEINDHMGRCAACREEYNQLAESAPNLQAVSFEEPTDEVLKSLWKSPFSRFSRNAGLGLVLGGWLALVLMGLYEFIMSPNEPFFPKFATMAVIIGFIILMVSVIRERMATYEVDPYKEIER